jgi:MFS family permease
MPLWSLIVVGAVLGIPNGFDNLGNQALLYQTAPAERIGVASGLYRTGQYVGANLASALVGLSVGNVATDESDSQWTHRAIAEHLARSRGIPISASQVGRILAEADLKPHKVRGWLDRPDDPEFFTRVQEICRLYQDIPAGTVLLSVDEKTGSLPVAG